MLRNIIVLFFTGFILPSEADVVAYISGSWKLTIVNNDNGFTQDTRQRIIDTFFHAYPQMQPRFNVAARKEVQLTIDPGYNGVAYAGKSIPSYDHLMKNCILRFIR